MGRDELLFCKEGDFRDVLESLKAGLRNEVQKLSSEHIAKTGDDQLCDHLIERFTLEPPILHDDKKAAHPPEDVDIDVRGRFDYAVDDDEPALVKGTSVTISIPFKGDGQWFEFKPSTYSLSGIRGRVVGKEIRLRYWGLPQEMSSEKIKQDMERDINMIKQYLQSMSSDANEHNKFIESEVKKVLAVRKEKIFKDEGLVGGLGIPIKRRDDAGTYTVPVVRKKPAVERPNPQSGNETREPILNEKEYDHILHLINQMSLVMERSPKAFQAMDEESLRWQFLVPLNSHYEGMATGETFNYSGKTDILIRFEGKNVFIAECKIWRGAKILNEAIDQLLGYTSWRDTKTAIILFNKNENFTAVLSQISEVVKRHPCFKKDLGMQGETTFKYNFCQPADADRELVLTVMAFNVPN